MTCVVVVPVYGARDLFEECLRSVVEHTTPGTRVLVADDASPDPGIQAFTEQLAAGAPVQLDLRPPRRRTSASSPT